VLEANNNTSNLNKSFGLIQTQVYTARPPMHRTVFMPQLLYSLHLPTEGWPG